MASSTIRPVGEDADGCGIWLDEATGERFNSGEPLTDAEYAEMEQRGDERGSFCAMCAGGYRGESPPAEIDCEFCQDTGYEGGRRSA